MPGNPHFKNLRRAFGFEEVSIVPAPVSMSPELVDISFKLGPFTFSIPILASAMDAVVSPSFAILFSKIGGLAVLNLEGIYTRYENSDEILEKIAQASQEEITSLLQRIYSEPIKERLIEERIKEIKEGGGICAVAITPANTKHLAPLAIEAGADILVVQSTVTTARHISKGESLVFSQLHKQVSVPILVGNCVSYDAALELMREGIDGVLVGVGPGAACTTREVLGVGVPQVTATMDCASAREQYFKETGRYVPIITDGGIRTGGDLCKALASGADAVMLGSTLAQAKEAPGRGYQWGMATPHPSLPRGTRIKVGTTGTLQQILFGPSSVTDGTQNLIGALKTTMGLCHSPTIKDFHNAEMVFAPSIKTEGKYFQR